MQTPNPRLERAATLILASLKKKRELNQTGRFDPVPPNVILGALLGKDVSISPDELKQVIAGLQRAGEPIAWVKHKKGDGYMYAMVWSEMEPSAQILKRRALEAVMAALGAVQQWQGAVKVFGLVGEPKAEEKAVLELFEAEAKHLEPERDNPAFS